MNKPCTACGASMQNVGPKRSVCDRCKQDRKNAWARKPASMRKQKQWVAKNRAKVRVYKRRHVENRLSQAIVFCRRCNQHKPRSSFGFGVWCRECFCNFAHERYLKEPERYRQKAKEYAGAHKESIVKKRRQKRADPSEVLRQRVYFRQRAQRNRDELADCYLRELIPYRQLYEVKRASLYVRRATAPGADLTKLQIQKLIGELQREAHANR